MRTGIGRILICRCISGKVKFFRAALKRCAYHGKVIAFQHSGFSRAMAFPSTRPRAQCGGGGGGYANSAHNTGPYSGVSTKRFHVLLHHPYITPI